MAHFDANTMPPGSKLWMLNLGSLTCDESFLLAGTNLPTAHSPQTITHTRRSLLLISALLHHPTHGLILFDAGGCESHLNPSSGWPPALTEYVVRDWEKGVHDLPSAIAAATATEDGGRGRTIADVKTVVLSHLHYDHAGGLEHFRGREDVEIWCHEEELKHAFWACATGLDGVNYLPEYLLAKELRWTTFAGGEMALFEGVKLWHVPGHTPGSIMMEVNLPGVVPTTKEGEKVGTSKSLTNTAAKVTGRQTVLFTGDLFHVKENWEEERQQGSGMITDYPAWSRSVRFVKAMARTTRARVVLGHEGEYFDKMPKSPDYLS